MDRLVEKSCFSLSAFRRNATLGKGRIPMECENGNGIRVLPSEAFLTECALSSRESPKQLRPYPLIALEYKGALF